jgi:hypothetical protein
MIQTFKEKAPTVQAVEFTNVLTQSASVADLIGASSMAVDMANKRTIFTVAVDAGDTTYTAEEGQVIGKVGGVIVVMAADEFYAKYEAI